MIAASSFTCRIWIAGDYRDACRSVREFCEEGACFAVSPADYIYTGGAEAGVVVTRINYPRFPKEPQEIWDQCERLAEKMRADLCQDSFAIEGPTQTFWYSRRSA